MLRTGLRQELFTFKISSGAIKHNGFPADDPDFRPTMHRPKHIGQNRTLATWATSQRNRELDFWHAQRESNPCLHRERVMS